MYVLRPTINKLIPCIVWIVLLTILSEPVNHVHYIMSGDIQNDNDNDIRIRHILEERMKIPPLCTLNNNLNTSDYDKIFKASPVNYAPYINRCHIKLKHNAHSATSGIQNHSKLNYIHVYKSGGTSVIDLFKHYLNIKDEDTVLWAVDNEFNARNANLSYNVLYNSFLFSFVRSPIERYLSSYFEYCRRGGFLKMSPMLMQRYNTTSPMQKFESVLYYMYKQYLIVIEHLLMCDNNECKDKYVRFLDSTQQIYLDAHFRPQMQFLLRNNYKHLPLDFVGDLNDYRTNNVTLNLIQHFGRNKNVKIHPNETQKRNRHSSVYQKYGEYRKYLIDLDMLKDEHIRMICELYWFDYICIPFDIPKQCNMTHMLLLHYGLHVEYKETCDVPVVFD